MADQPRSPRDAARAEEARRALAQVERETTTVGGSALARAVRHLGAADAPKDDPIEIWGRRIGRVLSLVFALYLVTWLVDWFGHR
jgi:ferric-dicitrate binding protein FerR (iron transport regulator)